MISLLGLVLALVQAPEKPIHLAINPDMMDYLELIAETDKNETARCIQGRRVAEDTIVLDAAYDTPWLILNRDDSSTGFQWWRCPVGTAAWWHSHPWAIIRKWSKARNLSPEVFCDLSLTDRSGRRYPFAIISIRRGLSCFFWQKPDGTYGRIPLERDEN